MASAGLLDRPAYGCGSLPVGTRDVIVVPAQRWRVIANVAETIDNDVLLDAITALQAAGETSAVRIADLLQLPHPLIEHLLRRTVDSGIRPGPDGTLEAVRTTTAWVYRDEATAELWPDLVDDTPPIPLRQTTKYEADYEVGTAGRPIRIRCLVLPTDGKQCLEPSPLELARFGRPSRSRGRRTSVVSELQQCLLVVPVRGTANGAIAEAVAGVPHLGLTRRLGLAAQEFPAVGRWVARLPRAEISTGAVLPLRDACHRLTTRLRHWSEEPSEMAAEAVLSVVALALVRYCDQAWYSLGREPEDIPAEYAAADLAAGTGIRAADAQLLIASGEPLAVASLAAIAGMGHGGPIDACALARIALRWLQACTSARPRIESPINELGESVLALCEELLASAKETDGRQAN